MTDLMVLGSSVRQGLLRHQHAEADQHLGQSDKVLPGLGGVACEGVLRGDGVTKVVSGKAGRRLDRMFWKGDSIDLF